MELSIEKFDDNSSASDDYKVSIGENRIITSTSFSNFTIPKLIADMKKFHQLTNKNKNGPLVIGFSADFDHGYRNVSHNYDTLTVCVDSQCLIVIISIIVSSMNSSMKNFPNALRDFLTDSNTILVGIGIEKVAKNFEKDFGFPLGKTVDLKSLAIEGLLRDGPEEDEQELNEEERRRKLRRWPLDDLLNKALGRKWKIRRETKKIELWSHFWDSLHEDRVKASTLDGYVAWKIGIKYLDLIKTKFLV